MDIHRLDSVEVRTSHVLHVRFTDGQKGEVDMKPYLSAEAFRPLIDPAEFERIHNGGYFVEWACGADLSADTLRSRLTVLNP